MIVFVLINLFLILTFVLAVESVVVVMLLIVLFYVILYIVGGGPLFYLRMCVFLFTHAREVG